MKPIIAFLLLLLPFTTSAAASKPVFNAPAWSLGWSKYESTDNNVYDEYVLKGETVDNWSQLVTIQYFDGLNQHTNLDIFEAMMKSRLTEVCSNIKWDSIEQKLDERTWTWSIVNCAGQPDQSEVDRAIKTNKGIYLFHYATKKLPFAEKDKEHWLKQLKEIPIN